MKLFFLFALGVSFLFGNVPVRADESDWGYPPAEEFSAEQGIDRKPAIIEKTGGVEEADETQGALAIEPAPQSADLDPSISDLIVVPASSDESASVE